MTYLRNTIKAVGLALAVSAASLTASASAGEPNPGGTLNVTSVSKWRTLNPAVQSGSATGIPGSQIFAGLLRVDDKFNPQPYLAESWDVSADGKSITFHLHKNATFHDGKPITSEDVAFSLASAKANHPFGKTMFATVESVETPDANTVIFVLSAPSPALLASLQPLLMPILPKHIFGDGQELKTHPRNNLDVVGSGPFMVAEHKLGESLVLVKNPNFFLEGRPYLDKIVITTSRNATTQVLELDRGGIHYFPFAFLTDRDLKRLSKNPKLAVFTGGHEALGPVTYLELNLRKEPYNDVRVRQAIASAFDYAKATVLLGNGFGQSKSFIHSGSPFYNSNLKGYSQDLTKAAALLDEAGLVLDSNGVRFTMVLDMPTYAKDRQEVLSETLKQSLRQIGIIVELRKSPDFGSWVKRVTSFEYEATLSGIWGYSDPVIGVHRLFKCDNIRSVIWTNTAGYCNPDVDAALNEAATTFDFAKRKAAYDRFQEIISVDLPLIPLTDSPTNTVYSAKLKNIPIHGWGALSPWDEVYFEK